MMDKRVTTSRPVLLSAIALLTLTTACSKSNSNAPALQSEAGSAPAARGDALRDRLDRALQFTLDKRHMDLSSNAAWQVVHGILVYGRDLQVKDNGKLVSAVDYLLRGGSLNGWTMRKGDHGVLAVVEAGTKTGQGHPDQWLGYLSQCGIAPEEPIKVGNHTYKVSDLIAQAQWDIHDGMEATWTLMAFSAYLPLDAVWEAKDGGKWSIERIVDMEADQNLAESACGGSHRMYGLAVALNRHLQEGGKLTGAWKKADAKIQQSIAKAKEYQQPDGSFSVNFFERPAGAPANFDIRLNRTGHIFEFLSVALNDQQLSEPWVQRALDAVLEMIEDTQDMPLECGSLYHAVHGLQLYRQRAFGAGTPRDEKPQLSENGAGSVAPK